MGNRYLYVGSITNAMRGKRILEKEGIPAYVHRSSNAAEGDGCGYSLLVTRDANRAVEYLRRGGVRLIRVSDAM